MDGPDIANNSGNSVTTGGGVTNLLMKCLALIRFAGSRQSSMLLVYFYLVERQCRGSF